MTNYNTQIKLVKLSIENFKGLKKTEVEFDGQDMNIFGDNGTGKTSLYDAFLWCLFDKDSSNASKFEIRPLTSGGKPKHKIDTKVSVTLLVNDQEVELTRTSTEKWVKKRGAATPDIIGMTNEYEVNGVPYTKTRFTEFVDGIVDETTFRKITSADYFFSLDKKKTRELLFDMEDDVTNEQILALDPKANPAIVVMDKKGYSVDDLQKVIRKESKKVKDELDVIPARIEELEESMPEATDKEDVQLMLDKIDEELSNIDDRLDLQDVSGLQSKQRQLAGHKQWTENKRAEIISGHAKQRTRLSEAISDGNDKVREFQEEKKEIESRLKVAKDRKRNYESELRKLRDDYILKKDIGTQVNKEEFQGLPEEETKCPQCGQDLPDKDRKKLAAQAVYVFEEWKKARLEQIKDDMKYIVDKGNSIKADKEEVEKKIADMEADAGTAGMKAQALTDVIVKLSGELSSLPETLPEESIKTALENDKDYQDMIKKIKRLEKETSGDNSAVDLIKRKSALMNEKAEIKDSLKDTERRKEIEQRIEELTERNRQLSAHFAKIEQLKDSMERMSRAKATLKEQTINKTFSYVSFRLQRETLSGSLEDDCEALIKGVPYSTNASRSERIRAGMDVVRAMQKHEGISAPLFIDNAESATHLIDGMECQIIRLVVSERDKKLRWERVKNG